MDIGTIFQTQGAAVGLSDLAAENKSDTRASRLCCEKGHEEV
jgi:hypothetical protein